MEWGTIAISNGFEWRNTFKNENISADVAEISVHKNSGFVLYPVLLTEV